MKTWEVTLPVSGLVYTTVEAESEEEAIEKALNGDYTLEDIQEWSTHEKIVQGNICYAIQWQAEATEVDGSGED
jgi:hypothetical protein